MSRVLVVDDELHIRDVLREFLTRVGDGGNRRGGTRRCRPSNRMSSCSTW